MEQSKLKDIQIVSCHCEGEVGDVIVSGVDPPPGDTVWEQSLFIAKDRTLKDFVLHEPRGGVFRHVNLLVPAKHPDADIGNVIMEPESCPPMSGSNTICVATVVLETGIIPMKEPETRISIEMPGGVVTVEAKCKDQKVQSVKFTNIPSYIARENIPLRLPDNRSIQVDIAFGGDSFVIVDAKILGFTVERDEARQLAETGQMIVQAAQKQYGFQHLQLKEMKEINFCLFALPTEIDEQGRKSCKHAVAIKPGKIDRCPTGTGVSARLAVMHHKKQVEVGEPVVFRSILGSEFTGVVERTTSIAGHPAVFPSVRGRAWRTGRYELTLDPEDPWPSGYKISDTWPVL